MSSPVYCPECDVLVTETGWGDEEGEYECRDCEIEFEVMIDPNYGLVTEVA